MGNRIIKESICISSSIDELSWLEEVFFYRLMVNCDDFGRMDGRPAILKARLFPLKNITTKDIESTINKLSAVGLVDCYTANNQPYLQLVTWGKHQVVRNKKSKYPDPNNLEKAEQIQAEQDNGKQLKSIEINCDSNPIQSNTNPNPIQKENNAHTREDDFSKIINLWQENVGLVNSILSEKISCLLEEVGFAVLKLAIERSVENGKRTFSYIQAIAKNIANGDDRRSNSGRSSSTKRTTVPTSREADAEQLGNYL